MKTCKSCLKSLPLENFHKNSSKKDGHDIYCKRCRTINYKAIAIKPINKTCPDMKMCSKCKKVKNAKEFYLKSSSIDGLSSWCIDCIKENAKKYYKENKETIDKQTKEYRKIHKQVVNETHYIWNYLNKEKFKASQRKYRIKRKIKRRNKRSAIKWDQTVCKNLQLMESRLKLPLIKTEKLLK